MTARDDRFQPSRAGVINVWDYADEEFVFADGRLVLRGHNGSGKTKALEVLFPFVLDGVADARRLDPFSGDNRTMKSNLLYRGQEAEYGYVWMEFARGRTETVTLVIGLRAHRNRDGVRTSFFVTDKRLGVDFGLLGPDSRPLTEKQLRDALGPGTWYKTATDYRAAVDARLFGLGRERYTQLLDLLLALRRPLLAKDLDPDKVSATLTAGLSPVDEELIDQAARDFENLAAVQRLFDDLTSADQAVTAFMADYTTYLHTHAKARLDRIRAATEGAAGHARAITAAMAEVERAGRAQAEAAEARDAAAAERDRLTARLAALKSNDAYLQQGDLELMRARISEAEADLGKERARHGRAAENLRLLAREADDVEHRLESGRLAIGRWSTALAEAAERAGIVADGDGAADTGEDLAVTAGARGAARREDIAHVRAHLAQLTAAEDDRRRAESALADAGETLERREADARAADEHLVEVREDAAENLAGWAGRWETVADSADVEALAATLEHVGEPGAPSLAEAFAGLSDDRRLEAAARVQALTTRREALAAELELLRAQRAAILAEHDDAPQANDQRTADRTGRPGAPLWQLVHFADGVAGEHAAAIEGALYGAGLLTAWVHPDPALTSAALAAAEPDGYLVPARSRPEGATLADVLIPEHQDLVPAAAIAAVLGSIALADELPAADDGPAVTGLVVTARAQFGLGAHVGARPKAAPEYIGATNRANRRRARLAEVDATLARLEAEDAEAAAGLDRRQALLADFKVAQRELPAAKPLLGAVQRVADQAILLAVARTSEGEARKALDGAVAEVDARRRRLRLAAEERIMPAVAEEIDAVAQAVEDFVAAAGRLDGERRNTALAETDLATRRAAVERLAAEHAEDTETLALKEKAHIAAVEEFSARERALDAPLKEILAQVEETDQAIKEAAAGHRRHEARAAEEERTLIRAEANMASGRTLVAEAMSVLLEQIASFAPYAHRDLRPLLGVADTTPWPAGPEQPPEDSAGAVVEALAHAAPDEAVRAALPDGVADLLDAFGMEIGGGRAVGDGALKSASSQMSDALRAFGDALASCEADYRLDYDPTGVVMVFVIDEEGRNPVAVFARRVAERAGDQGALLEARERTVLEDELLAGLARQIHGRVLAARELVRGMNTDTRSRPMSSGTAIGIRWAHSDRIDDRQRAVSRLLARDAQELGPSGLAELRAGLREMIRDHRARHPRATYKEVLAAVLDYRTWHTFELLLVVPGEPEVRLTRAKHSVMSGGEKSAAIHLPLFAAANALYSSAAYAGPRMIALDEAFAGIDDKYKPDLLGLTVKFDLDLFMTGHDLWVHHDTVPMAAHYDMHHDKAAHAVSAMLVLWDGTQMVDAEAGFAGNDELAEELLGIAPRRHVPPAVEETLLTALGDQEDDEEDES
jgi:hypothetical protein